MVFSTRGIELSLIIYKSFFPYHLVKISPWPVFFSVGVRRVLIGILHIFYSGSIFLVKIGLLVRVFIYGCWRYDIYEESYSGFHTEVVQIGLKIGFALFIVREVAFFFAFFWAFFHRRCSPSVELGIKWPPEGIMPFNFSSIPLLNTLLLLARGVLLTSAHIFFIKIPTFIPTPHGSTTVTTAGEYRGVNFIFEDDFEVEKSFTEAQVQENFEDCVALNGGEVPVMGEIKGDNWNGSYSVYFDWGDLGWGDKDYFFYDDQGNRIVDNRMKVRCTQHLFFRIYPVWSIFCWDVDIQGSFEHGDAVFLNHILELIVAVLGLGVLFTLFQIIEYMEAYFSIIDGVYGRTFFIATGFHGFHVLVGTIFLWNSYVILERGNFKISRHIWLSASIWYWHFVDVVWLFLFVFIYWWGGIRNDIIYTPKLIL